MATRCPECREKFTAREALCEDWRNPEASFGCPHCGTFFVKDMNPGSRERWLATLFSIGIVLQAGNLLFRYFLDGAPAWVLLHASVILVSASAIAIIVERRSLRPLEKSPWQPGPQGRDRLPFDGGQSSN